MGARRCARGRAQPPVRGLRQRGLPGARRGCRACGGGAPRPAPARAHRSGGGVPVLCAARRAAVARHQVRAGGRGDRRRGGAGALAGAAPHARRGGGGALAVLRGVLRGLQRGALRWPYALCRGCDRRERHRRRLSGRLPGAHIQAGRALHRPRVRLAALGAGIPARVRGPLVAVALASRAAGRGAAGGSRDPARGRALRRRVGRAAAGGHVRGADDVRLLVPTAAPAGRSATGAAAGGHGATPPAAAGDRACPAHRGRLGLALRGRAVGRRLAGRQTARCAVRAAHRAAPAVPAGRRVAVLARRRDRGGAGAACPP